MTERYTSKIFPLFAKTETGGKGESLDIVLSFGAPISLKKASGDDGYVLPLLAKAGLGAFQRDGARGLDAIRALEMVFSFFNGEEYHGKQEIVFNNLALNEQNDIMLYFRPGESASAVMGRVHFAEGGLSVPLYVRDIVSPEMPICPAARLLKEMRSMGKMLAGNMRTASRGVARAIVSPFAKNNLRCG